MNLKKRSFLTLKDFTKEEIRGLLDLSHQVKKEKKEGKILERFKGKNLAMIFEKPSTRTRCAFQTAFGEESGNAIFLSTSDIQLGSKETVEDTARVLGRMFDAIEFRGFKQETVNKLAEYSGVPVYNGLTDQYHPTQILADLMTMEENFDSLEGKKLCYIGDGRNNMANSLMIGCAKMGVSFTIIAPVSLQPDKDLVKECQAWCDKNTLVITNSLEEGVLGADAIYTDVWASMGEETKAAERIALLRPYQVNKSVIEMTKKEETIFLHCLPAVRGNEVTHEVLEADYSKVWDEAENRKHTIKAVMLATL